MREEEKRMGASQRLTSTANAQPGGGYDNRKGMSGSGRQEEGQNGRWRGRGWGRGRDRGKQ